MTFSVVFFLTDFFYTFINVILYHNCSEFSDTRPHTCTNTLPSQTPLTWRGPHFAFLPPHAIELTYCGANRVTTTKPECNKSEFQKVLRRTVSLLARQPHWVSRVAKSRNNTLDLIQHLLSYLNQCFARYHTKVWLELISIQHREETKPIKCSPIAIDQ